MTSEPPPYEICPSKDLNDRSYRYHKCLSEDHNMEEKVAFYDMWANSHDEDVKFYGSSGPEITVEYLERYFGDRDGTYLDCGAGTGLLGIHIKSLEYTYFHALDGSKISLEKAKSRNAYSKFIQEYITTGRLSVKTGTYDGLVCCACFCPGHLEPDCVEDWCRIVKKGGVVIIVMNQRWLSKASAYKDGKLEAAFQKRVDEGKWEAVVREQRPGFVTGQPAEIFVFRVK